MAAVERRGSAQRDPWERSPVGELQDPLLPRWFVLLALVMVPLAVVVFVLAFFLSGPEEVPVAARRPPPDGGYSHQVGDVLLGTAAAVRFDAACPEADGLAVAGTEGDRALLRRALASLCNARLDAATAEALRMLAAAGAEVRFAAFEATGVDSAVVLEGDPPQVLVNARFAQVDRPSWIAPLVAHDAVTWAGRPGEAATALEARRAEVAVCDALVPDDQRSRGCVDAGELLTLDDPLAALRDVGYAAR